MPSPSVLLGVGAVLSTLSAPALATKYQVQDSYTGANWLDAFKFETYDLNNGFVDYVDEATAKSKKLYRTEGSDVLFGVDSSETLNSADGGDKGRKSVRLEGKKEYNHGLFVIDVKAMPSVCGMWPAFWSLGREPWPVKGEIDIIEGVNKNTVNKYVLHTDTQCKVDGQGQSGTPLLTDCALDSASGASGCDVNDVRTNSFGAGFNSNGGGIYAMEWDSDAIKTWFFPRGSSIPASLTKGEPDTSEFGLPAANFKGDCNIDQRFKDQRFIFTNNFCGDWAGNVYAQSGCPQYTDSNGQALSSMASCKKYVAENPNDFKNAFWRISSFKTYQKKTVVSSSSVARTSTRTSTRASSTPVRSPSSSLVRSTRVRSSSAHASSTPVHVSSSVYVPGSSSVAHSSVESPSGYPASSSVPPYPASPSAAYPSVAYPSDSYPSAVYPSDAYPSAAYPSDAYPSVAYPSDAYPSVAYPSDAYPSVAYPSDTYPSAAYPSAAYPSVAYPSDYPASPSASEYPGGDNSYPVYPGSDYPAQSTPCSTGAQPGYETPVYPVYPDSETSVPVYPEYPASPSKSVHDDYDYLPDFTPVSPIYPEVTSKPSYGNGYDSTPGSKTSVTTTYTTTYVDVCETGYTTITTTHVVTYHPSTTPAVPTPGSDYPVYPPPGFEITTKVCNKGCGKGPQTVTVTLPCTKCGGYPTEETPATYPTGETPATYLTEEKPATSSTSTKKIYVTKTITLSKVTVSKSDYYVQAPPSPVYPVYDVKPSGGYSKTNVTATHYGPGYSTGNYKPTPTKTGYDVPEFTGAASSFKAGGVVVVAAFAALLF